MKRIAFDLDGVLMPEMPVCDRPFSLPAKGLKELVNQVYLTGKAIVCIYTARPWTDYRITHAWLVQHGFKFHMLLMGKWPYDLLIDDRSTTNPFDALRLMNLVGEVPSEKEPEPFKGILHGI
jgi:hypothetical protein